MLLQQDRRELVARIRAGKKPDRPIVVRELEKPGPNGKEIWIN